MSIRYKCGTIRLTNEQWERVRKHFPEEHIADGRPGRKPVPTRHVLEAVLWILNTGAQWHIVSVVQSAQRRKNRYSRMKTGDRRSRTGSGHAPFVATLPTAVAVQRSPPQAGLLT
ncbi:MAG: transposase [Xanthobacteraceae bacterium]